MFTKVVLAIIAICSFFFAADFSLTATTVMHQILAALYLLTFTVALGIFAIVETLHKVFQPPAN